MAGRELSANLAGPSSRNYGAITANFLDPDDDFSPTELYSLREDISSNLFTINKNWKNLEKCCKTLGTVGDNSEFRKKIVITHISTNQLIAATSKELKRLTAIVKRGDDKQQKLQVERLTNAFSEAVQKYSQIQKKTYERMKATLLITMDDAYTPNASNDYEERAKLLAQRKDVNRELKFEQDMLIEREDRIKQIESNMEDINQLMRELASVVHLDGEMIDTIENGIERTAHGIEEGTSELRKAEGYQQKYRRRMFILLVVFVTIAALVLWIVISSLKS